MPLTLERLEAMVKAQGLNYFTAPERTALCLNFSAPHGRHLFVITLDADGSFLQFRSVSDLVCPADHHRRDAMLATMAEINFQIRFVKLGWDPSDGEIVCYGDQWVIDTEFGDLQLRALIASFVLGLDASFYRLRRVLETGQDPGFPEMGPFAPDDDTI